MKLMVLLKGDVYYVTRLDIRSIQFSTHCINCKSKIKTHLLGSKAASSEHTVAIKFHVSFVFVTHSYGGVGELRRE